MDIQSLADIRIYIRRSQILFQESDRTKIKKELWRYVDLPLMISQLTYEVFSSHLWVFLNAFGVC